MGHIGTECFPLSPCRASSSGPLAMAAHSRHAGEGRRLQSVSYIKCTRPPGGIHAGPPRIFSGRQEIARPETGEYLREIVSSRMAIRRLRNDLGSLAALPRCNNPTYPESVHRRTGEFIS